MRFALAILVGLAITTLFAAPVTAQDMRRSVELEINQVYVRKFLGVAEGWPAVIVTVSNTSATRLRDIKVTCSWLNQGTPIAERSINVRRLAAFASQTEEFWTDATNVPFDTGRCAVTAAKGDSF